MPVTTENAQPTELLKVSEFAARFRVTERSVYRWIASGQIDAERIGGVVRIRASRPHGSAAA